MDLLAPVMSWLGSRWGNAPGPADPGLVTKAVDTEVGEEAETRQSDDLAVDGEIAYRDAVASVSRIEDLLSAVQRPRGAASLLARDLVAVPACRTATLATTFTVNQIWQILLHGRGGVIPPDLYVEVFRLYGELMLDDAANVARGIYPRELLYQFPFNPSAREAADFAQQVLAMAEARQSRKANLANFDSLAPRLRADMTDMGFAEPEIVRCLVDMAEAWEYYGREFHWQQEGWLSHASAARYDLLIQVLFLGSLEAMRRMAMAPLRQAVQGIANPQVLDLACGTGHYLAGVSQILPHAELYGLELSPYYLHAAGKLFDGNPRWHPLAASATRIPLADTSMDVVNIGYLLHELRPSERRLVLQEARRVLKPSGTLIIYDAVQKADNQRLAAFLEDFFPAGFHEPYFKSYQHDDISEQLAAAGFTVTSRHGHFLTTVVTGTIQSSPSTRSPAHT